MAIEYKGVTINFNEASGNFSAVRADGTRIIAPSLASAKKKIDGLDKFASFTALAKGWKEVTKVTVVGVKVARGNSRFAQREWKLSSGGTVRQVYADTPENEKALSELEEMNARHRAEQDSLRDKQSAERDIAEANIVVLKP